MSNSRVVAMRTGIAIVVIISVIMGWLCRPGVFSYFNYCIIFPGMTLTQVEALLGKPGREIPPHEVPGTSAKAFVSGDRVFRWEDGNRVIFISLKNGVVYEKYYREPSF